MSDDLQVPVPRLTDGTVLLRALEQADLDAVVEQSQDPVVQRWSLTVPTPYGRRDAEDFLALAQDGWVSGERWQWAVEADGRFAGLVDLSHRGEGVREIGYAGHPATRGRGHLTRATRLAVAHAFAAGCPLVLWHAAAGNAASRRVAWHAGFTIAPGQTPIVRGTVVRSGWSGTLTPHDLGTPTTPWLRPAALRAGPGQVAVRLRPWVEDDARLLPVGHDPTPTSYAAWHAEQLGAEAAGERLSWVVTSDADPTALLGAVQLTAPETWTAGASVTVDGWLWPHARGRGVAEAALDAVLTHALAPASEGGLGVLRVEARAGADDRPALRLLHRVGFHDVGATGPATAARTVLEVAQGDDRVELAHEPVQVPVLETARLRLRPYRDDDAPGPDEGPDELSRRFLPARAHPDTAAFPDWLARQRREQDAGESLPWCVADRESDRAVGYLVLFRMGPLPGRFDAEVGYWLVPSARGRGCLSEALAPALEHAFAPLSEGGLGLTRLHAGTDADNLASQATLERVGFRRWGADRQAWRRTDGTLCDGVYLELLATDERVDRRARGLRPVTLEGSVVRLRPLRPDDAPRIVTACSDPRTRQWLSTLPAPYRLEHALDYVASAEGQAAGGEALKLAVADPSAGDVLIGAISLMDLDGDTPGLAEVGYWTHPDARGRGVMTEAVRLVVRHAFAPTHDGGLGLRRLVLRAAAGNTASQHVAAGAGFVVAGRHRRAEQLGDGTWDDLVDHDLLADEWDARA